MVCKIQNYHQVLALSEPPSVSVKNKEGKKGTNKRLNDKQWKSKEMG